VIAFPDEGRAVAFASVDRAKPAIYRHFKTGHFRIAAEAI
jgi:hypothetical protein